MKAEYSKSVNRVLAFIDQHIDDELSLAKVAAIGNYAPFHLHRIFKAFTNETPNAYITRKRVEKTAAVLLHQKEVSVTEIAHRYGFNSNSSFTRAFKKFYGVSPSKFRALSPSHYSKISQTQSKNGQVPQLFEQYLCRVNELKDWIGMNAKIEIKQLPKLHLAFITQIGPDGLADAFNRLLKWARPKGLLDQPGFKVARIYHDSFKLTEANKVRMSACVLLAAPMAVGGEVGLTAIESGRWIVAHLEIEPKDFEKSWRALYVWMNENGYQKADRNPFEIYHNNYLEHPEGKCNVDLHIPIE